MGQGASNVVVQLFVSGPTKGILEGSATLRERRDWQPSVKAKKLSLRIGGTVLRSCLELGPDSHSLAPSQCPCTVLSHTTGSMALSVHPHPKQSCRENPVWGLQLVGSGDLKESAFSRGAHLRYDCWWLPHADGRQLGHMNMATISPFLLSCPVATGMR